MLLTLSLTSFTLNAIILYSFLNLLSTIITSTSYCQWSLVIGYEYPTWCTSHSNPNPNPNPTLCLLYRNPSYCHWLLVRSTSTWWTSHSNTTLTLPYYTVTHRIALSLVMSIGQEYFDMVDEFMAAVFSRWPGVVVQVTTLDPPPLLPPPSCLLLCFNHAPLTYSLTHRYLTYSLIDISYWMFCGYCGCGLYSYCVLGVAAAAIAAAAVTAVAVAAAAALLLLMLVRGFRNFEGGPSAGEVPPHLPRIQRRHSGHRLCGAVRSHVSGAQLWVLPGRDAYLVCGRRYD